MPNLNINNASTYIEHLGFCGCVVVRVFLLVLPVVYFQRAPNKLKAW